MKILSYSTLIVQGRQVYTLKELCRLNYDTKFEPSVKK